MKKPVYPHPSCVVECSAKIIEKTKKRLWLSLTIDKNRAESIIVILKNPSRATIDVSDKTVYTVTKYIDINRSRNAVLKNVGTVIILNLIPFYETYSDQLINLSDRVYDEENIRTIKDLASRHKKVIIAWGNPPKGLEGPYLHLRDTVCSILSVNKNEVYHVDRLTTKGNPKHGQVWSYDDPLRKYR